MSVKTHLNDFLLQTYAKQLDYDNIHQRVKKVGTNCCLHMIKFDLFEKRLETTVT